MDVWPGIPFPLGPTWDGSGTNFAIFSENAERVELCLFDADDRETRIELTEREAFNWHCYLPGIGPGPAVRLPRLRRRTTRRRASGSTRHKLLIDPYAKAIEGAGRLGRRERRCPTSRACDEDADLEIDDEDDARRDPEVRRHRPDLRLGGRPAAEPPVARDGHLRGARRRASRSCIPTCARTCAAPMRASRRSRRSSTSRASASRRSSCCRCTTSSTRASCTTAA